jgi:hypothetical protein
MSVLAPPHEIIVISPEDIESNENSKTLRDQCYSLRVQVFHEEQGFPLDTEFDEYAVFMSQIYQRPNFFSRNAF